jgi:hypothetical protein
MQMVRQAMQDAGIPPTDLYSPEPSPERFPDGAHCRIELAGVERLSTFKTLVDEADRRGVPVHRVIATVAGSLYLDKRELKDMAALGAERRIEVIMTPGPQRGMDTGRQFTTPEGLVSGMRVRGQDTLAYVIKEIMRCIDAGFRGFLVTDEGLLWLLNGMRAKGIIPKDVIFKISVFAGHANAAGCRLMESLGANSINPLADLTLPMLAAIRKSVRIPIDVYVILVRAMGGFNRFYEAADIARFCSPCYFKFEPGESEAAIYAPWNEESFHSNLMREKVRYASIVAELLETLDPSIKLSGSGPADLAIPKV